jgi:hypothetical protein
MWIESASTTLATRLTRFLFHKGGGLSRPLQDQASLGEPKPCECLSRLLCSRDRVPERMEAWIKATPKIPSWVSLSGGLLYCNAYASPLMAWYALLIAFGRSSQVASEWPQRMGWSSCSRDCLFDLREATAELVGSRSPSARVVLGEEGPRSKIPKGQRGSPDSQSPILNH